MTFRTLVVLVVAGCGEVTAVEDAAVVGGEVSVGEDAASIDAIADGASTCSACQAPDAVDGAATGTASCAAMPNACAARFENLAPIDLCSCSAGEPALYVAPISMTGVNLALVIEPNPTTYSAQVEGLGCFSLSEGACNLACTGRALYAYPGVPLAAGSGPRRIIVHLGDECAKPLHVFTVTP